MPYSGRNTFLQLATHLLQQVSSTKDVVAVCIPAHNKLCHQVRLYSLRAEKVLSPKCLMNLDTSVQDKCTHNH